MTQGDVQDYLGLRLMQHEATAAMPQADKKKLVGLAIRLGLKDFWSRYPWSFKIDNYTLTIASSADSYELPDSYDGVVSAKETTSACGQSIQVVAKETFDRLVAKPSAYSTDYPAMVTAYRSRGKFYVSFYPIPNVTSVYFQLTQIAPTTFDALPEKAIGAAVAHIEQFIHPAGTSQYAASIARAEQLVRQLARNDSAYQGTFVKFYDGSDSPVEPYRPWVRYRKLKRLVVLLWLLPVAVSADNIGDLRREVLNACNIDTSGTAQLGTAVVDTIVRNALWTVCGEFWAATNDVVIATVPKQMRYAAPSDALEVSGKPVVQWAIRYNVSEATKVTGTLRPDYVMIPIAADRVTEVLFNKPQLDGGPPIYIWMADGYWNLYPQPLGVDSIRITYREKLSVSGTIDLLPRYREHVVMLAASRVCARLARTGQAAQFYDWYKAYRQEENAGVKQ